MRAAQSTEVHLLEGAIPLLPLRFTKAAMEALRNGAAEGIVNNIDDMMPFISRILYPAPCGRKVLSCCFTSLCILSASGSLTGCGLTSLHNIIAPPEIIQEIFAFPAVMGWLAGCCCSAVGAWHYRYELGSREITEDSMQQPLDVRRILIPNRVALVQPAIMADRVEEGAGENPQPPLNQLSGDNVRAAESIQIGMLEELPAVIRPDIRVRPIGYTAPAIPSPRQMF